jgi:hypothetical protein
MPIKERKNSRPLWCSGRTSKNTII